MAGNVAHAVLTAPTGRVPLAAAAAVVPPAVLLGSTHSVALLVRARRVGVPYWCALLMTLALAGCAFVLSFDALRDLAVAVGIPPDRAWLWPVAIDASIANSTVALLSMSPARTSRRTPSSIKAKADPRKTPATAAAVASPSAPSPVTSGLAGQSPALGLRASPEPQRLVAPWKTTAEELIRSGVTSKDPEVVATVLAEHAAGTPRSTIGRRLAIHHQTVGRILAGADALAG
ncbi:DUF2637 domain-containing protein [Mycobacterium sp.]|uniref:DUF2637 domain-containing protein n=1 Tax=Mycobacterium sp. TaxID=1785 RepID=UPI003D0B3E93